MENVCAHHLNHEMAAESPPPPRPAVMGSQPLCWCFLCHQIPISALVSFVEALEVGYSKHKNPYHNLMHAADVTQTVHYLLLKTGMVVSQLNREVTCSKSIDPSWTYSIGNDLFQFGMLSVLIQAKHIRAVA